MAYMKIYLIGFMGCGKSTFGAELARKLNFMFVDLDEYIVENQERSIEQIFKEEGEDGFRDIERDELGKLSGLFDTVIATGGGTPCFHDNLEWMNATGTSIYLKTPPEILAARLAPEKEHRPLIANLSDKELPDFIHKKILERSAFYEQAEIIYEQKNENMPVAEDLAKLYPFW